MKNLFSLILTLLLLAGCSGSDASEEGFRAVYSDPTKGGEMTILASSDGNIRVTVKGQDMWGMHIDGTDYFIFPKEEGEGEEVVEMRMAMELMKEVVPQELLDMAKRDKVPAIKLRNDGETEVNGRKGIGYRQTEAPKSGPFFLVISDDPELEPVGKVMVRQFKTSALMNPLASPEIFADVFKVLDSGSPIMVGNASLQSFDRTKVDDDMMILPGKPLDKDAARALLIEKGVIPKEPPKLFTGKRAPYEPIDRPPAPPKVAE